MAWSWWSRRQASSLVARFHAKLKGVKITRRDLKIFIPAFLALFSSAYSLTMLFPFLPFMIQFLLPQVEEEDIGKYAGFIASSLYLGRFFGSYVWGTVADKKGRKPVVITSCVLMGLFSAAFGFSVQIYMAVIFRFFIGLFNGVVGTVKAIISESSTNRSQALGMSLITCAFSLGLILGPAISGALADPIGQYNLTISDPVVRGFLTKFPYSLPCLFNFLLCFLAVVVVAIWMPETLRSKTSKDSSNDSSSSVSEDQQQLLVAGESDEQASRLTDVPPDLEIASQSLETETVNAATNSDDDDKRLRIEVCGEEGDRLEPREGSCEREEEKMSPVAPRYSGRRSSLVPFFNRRSSFTPSYFKPLRFPRNSSGGSGGGGKRYTSLHSGRQRLVFEEHKDEEEEEGEGKAAVEEERVALKCAGERDVGEEKGLFGRLGQSFKKTLQNLKLFFTTRATLLSLMIYCTFSFALIGFDEVYSIWAAAASRLGGLGWTLHEIGISQAVSGALFLPFAFTLFPVLERRFGLTTVFQLSAITGLVCMVTLPIAHSISPDSLNPLRWFYIILVLFVIRLAAGNVFASTALFINNSVVFGKLGEVNGLAHSLTALLRTVAPVFSGTIFSLSVSRGARHAGFPVNHYLIFLIFGLTILLCTVFGAGLPASINRQKKDESSDSVISGSDSSSISIRTDDDSNSSSSGNRPETNV